MMYTHPTAFLYATSSHFSALFLSIYYCPSVAPLTNGVSCSKNRKICLLLPGQPGCIKLFLNKTLSFSLFLGLCLQRQRPVLLWWDQRGEGKNEILIIFFSSVGPIQEFALIRKTRSVLFHSLSPILKKLYININQRKGGGKKAFWKVSCNLCNAIS